MHDRRLATIGSLLALGLLAGCGSSVARFTPAPALARTSLDTALAAWRDGRPAESIAGTPAIQIVDTSRQPGRPLRSFEILSEAATGAQGRAFVVRLKFDSPAAELRARYVVVGLDPIWIFHKDDYDRLAHWEHPMEVSQPAEPAENQVPPTKSTPAEPAAPAGSARLPPATHARF